MTSPTTSTSDKGSTKTSTKDGSQRWKVRLTHPLDNRKVVFSSVSETRARQYVVNRYPRGEEAYLEAPDGSTESYQQERTGSHGEDAEQWAAFDPASYIPPDEQAPPGESAWADVES